MEKEKRIPRKNQQKSEYAENYRAVCPYDIYVEDILVACEPFSFSFFFSFFLTLEFCMKIGMNMRAGVN